MFVIRFRVEARPERAEDLSAALKEIVPRSRAIAGVIAFEIGRDLTDPNALIATEVYEDTAARERQAALPEDAKLASIRRDVERARNIASSENHGLVAEGDTPSAPLTSISVPTLVIHGTADPMFPLEHGQALVNEIPGARLLPLEGSGHGVERADWE